jgi:DNA sulphur modification protein DndE
MSSKPFRPSAQARDQRIRLKTRNGIPQGNILCRWTFCLSRRQPPPPTPLDIPSDSNAELTTGVRRRRPRPENAFHGFRPFSLKRTVCAPGLFVRLLFKLFTAHDLRQDPPGEAPDGFHQGVPVERMKTII